MASPPGARDAGANDGSRPSRLSIDEERPAVRLLAVQRGVRWRLPTLGLFPPDKIERAILLYLARAELDDRAPKDRTSALTVQIVKVKTTAAKIEMVHLRSMKRLGALAEATQVRLERDHARQLGALHSDVPASGHQSTLQSLQARALADLMSPPPSGW